MRAFRSTLEELDDKRSLHSAHHASTAALYFPAVRLRHSHSLHNNSTAAAATDAADGATRRNKAAAVAANRATVYEFTSLRHDGSSKFAADAAATTTNDVIIVNVACANDTRDAADVMTEIVTGCGSEWVATSCESQRRLLSASPAAKRHSLGDLSTATLASSHSDVMAPLSVETQRQTTTAAAGSATLTSTCGCSSPIDDAAHAAASTLLQHQQQRV